MPYTVRKKGDKYVVYKKSTGERVGATAGNKEALRKYMAALHINAKEGVLKEEDDAAYEGKLKSIFKKDYASFVAALGSFAKDSKFREFVKQSDEHRSTVKLTAIPVVNLIPTQNEIDVDKSLKFPLTEAPAAQYALKGGNVKVAAPIITFNGKYVIDGHHRWSQLYAINKEAKIVAYDFTNPEIKNPLDALKATQLAIIGAGASKIPSNKVEGDNLLKMEEKKVKYYVMNTITQAVLYAFEESGKVEAEGDDTAFRKAVADYISANVKSMQQTSQPVAGAPGRGIMPQADDVPGGQKATVAALAKGLPVAERMVREAIRKEISKLLRK